MLLWTSSTRQSWTICQETVIAVLAVTPNETAALFDPEFLNSLEEPGIPPHEITLKVRATCRITRNFDASRGLTTNTRVIICKLLRYTVEVETISSNVAGKVVAPVRFKFDQRNPAQLMYTLHSLRSHPMWTEGLSNPVGEG
jgi:hypothetical protein